MFTHFPSLNLYIEMNFLIVVKGGKNSEHRHGRLSQCLPTNGYYVRISLLLSCSSSSLSTRCTMAPRGDFKPRRRAGWSAKKLREMPVLRSVPGLRPLQLFPLAGRLYDFMRRRVAERLLRIGTDEAMEDLVFHFLTDHGEKFWVFDHEICGYDHMYGE